MCRMAQQLVHVAKHKSKPIPGVDGVPSFVSFLRLVCSDGRACVCAVANCLFSAHGSRLYYVDLMVVIPSSFFFVLFFVGVLLHTNGGLPVFSFSRIPFLLVTPPQYRRRLPG
ncbi:unnamed protein product, partial [Ectocarpus sp. 12 AP-2014]